MTRLRPAATDTGHAANADRARLPLAEVGCGGRVVRSRPAPGARSHSVPVPPGGAWPVGTLKRLGGSVLPGGSGEVR